MRHVNIFRNAAITIGITSVTMVIIWILGQYYSTELKSFTSLIGCGTIGYLIGSLVTKYFPLND